MLMTEGLLEWTKYCLWGRGPWISKRNQLLHLIEHFRPHIGTKTTYSSILDTIFNVEKAADPLFSLAISRDESNTDNGGKNAIGRVLDLDDLEVNATNAFGHAPLLSDESNPITILSGYSIAIDSISCGTTTENYTKYAAGSAANGVYVVDSGTTLSFVPTHVAKAVNALFVPAAERSGGLYYVICNATTPYVSLTIGGVELPISPKDLIYGALAGGQGLCLYSVGDSDVDGVDFIGDSFLRSMLAVFDWGESEIRFARRPYYET